MTHLNLYLTGKLFWNADEDVDKILDEYYRLFYGDAADEMKLFWGLAEKIWMKKLDITGVRGKSGFLKSQVLKNTLYDQIV